MKTKWIIYGLAITLVAVSCKSTKTITKETKVSKVPVEQIVNQVKQREPKFDNANVSKMSLELQLNSRNIKVAASCKLITGSAMHISIMPALGIEMFKLEISTDSIYIFDKFNKRYYGTDYEYLEKRFGVELDYNSLESLISNRFFVVGQKEIPYSKLSQEIVEGKQIINYKGQNMTELVTINSLFSIENVSIASQNSKYNLTTSYADFALLDGIDFPQKIQIQASNNKNKLHCDFNINRVTFNGSVSLQALDKNRYQKTDIEQLMKK
jgi:hypothetical protein